MDEAERAEVTEAARAKPQAFLVSAILAGAVAVGAGGCGSSEIGRYGWQEIIVRNPQRVRSPIVKSEDYWIQREVEPEEAFPGPTPADLAPPETDYILGPGDLIDITVYELIQPNQPYVSRQRLSQSGQITLPYIGTIKASGLTVRGLEEKVADILEPDYIMDPQVTVFVQEYRNLSVSVISGLFRPGVYQMAKQDMRLLELVASAGGVTQLIEDYGYVIREYKPEEADLLMLESGAPPEGPAAPAAAGPAQGPPKEPAPAGVTEKDRDLLQKMAEGQMPEVRAIEKAEAQGAGAPAPPAPPAADEEQLGRWIWQDGKWVEVEAAPVAKVARQEGRRDSPRGAAPEVPAPEAAPEAPAPTPAPTPADEARLRLERKLARLGVVQGSGQLKRIIRFDVKALLAGDPTQNVVLRDDDIVTVPSLPQGDFYMAGQVARPGVYSLTGRKITLLQAVAAAGGLTAVAVPWRTEVVRRVAEDEQEFIYVDIAKIARGEVPDFYLQPEDVIRVGTDQAAVWDAVLRNAFRATYGLGAVYDTNFADFYPWTDAVSPLFPGLH